VSIRRMFAPGGLLAGAVLAAGLSAALAAAPPVVVVVHLPEVPKGFTAKSLTFTNATEAKALSVTKAQVVGHGRITGVETVFTRGKVTGIFEIASIVSQYKTPAGAAWEFQKSYAGSLKLAKSTAAPKIGDQSAGLVEASKDGKYLQYGMVFRRGAYDMTIALVGVKGTVSINSAVPYARLMASRAH